MSEVEELRRDVEYLNRKANELRDLVEFAYLEGAQDTANLDEGATVTFGELWDRSETQKRLDKICED